MKNHLGHLFSFLPRLFAYLLIGVLVYWFIGLASPSPVFAQKKSETTETITKSWVDDDYADCLEAATDRASKKVCAGAYASMTQGSLMTDMVRRILGPVPGLTTTVDVWQRNPQYAQRMLQGSAITGISNTIAAMYTNPPANLALWVRDAGQTLGFIPRQANAQGIGFSGLSALLPLWKAFRNVAYLLMAIVMIVIGFMVMFRKKIDPKTVVTVQNALPKIVMTLLLITFSYAIVGVMVDLMYFAILLAVGLFQTTGLLPNPADVAHTFGYTTNQALFSQGSLLMNMGNIFGTSTPVGNFGGITTPTSLVWQIFGIDPGWGKIGSAVAIIGGIALIPVVGAGGLLLSGLGAIPPLLGFILGLAILFLLIKLFIFFFGSYIQIILALIFSPLQILSEALPGSSAFANWFKNLFSNLIVFPIGAVMFMLSAVFANMANQDSSPLWVPPFTPLVSSSTRSIAALLALGILFTIPTIAGAIKEALKAKPFVPAGPEGVFGALAQPAGVGFQIYQFLHSREQVNVLRKIAGNNDAKTSGQPTHK